MSERKEQSGAFVFDNGREVIDGEDKVRDLCVCLSASQRGGNRAAAAGKANGASCWS